MVKCEPACPRCAEICDPGHRRHGKLCRCGSACLHEEQEQKTFKAEGVRAWVQVFLFLVCLDCLPEQQPSRK